MKSKFKNSWRSVVPLHTQDESATSFCIFPRVKSLTHSPGKAPVYLNVYDLTPINGYVSWAGLGIFHSGIEVYDIEYAFGAHEFPTSGVFEVEPRHCPGFRFRKSIFVGTTDLNPHQVRDFIEKQSANYHGDKYHLVAKNCNHFSEDICYKLTGNRIPKWINRLARIGSYCNWMLPEALRKTNVSHETNRQDSESEKKSLRSSFSCFSSISTHNKEKEVSISSFYLHTHYKDCLPPWEFKKSASTKSVIEEVRN